MDKLLAKLNEQQAVLHQQNEALKSATGESMFPRGFEKTSSGSLPITPAADSMAAPTTSLTRPASAASQSASDELLRLKLELAEAQNKISHLEAQTRLVRSESGRNTPIGFASPDMPSGGLEVPFDRPSLQLPFIAAGSRLPFARQTGWPGQDDGQATELNDTLPGGRLTRTKSIWNAKSAFSNSFANVTPGPVGSGPQPVPWSNPRSSAQPFGDSTGPFSPPELEPYRSDRVTPDPDMMRPSSSRRGNRLDNRFASNAGFGSGFGSYMGGGAYDGAAAGYGSAGQGGLGSNLGMSLFPPYQQQSMTSPLSPLASEFNTAGGPWKTEVCAPYSGPLLRGVSVLTLLIVVQPAWTRGSDVPSLDGTSQLSPPP
jgi:hypothetical protein